jgi:molybdate transport system substrate-binding protein
VNGAVTVSAAASLTESFTTIKDDFVEQNPDATVTINFGSSGQLATQIESGAPADVAAFADEAPMTKLVDGGLIDGTPEIFARNQLVIVTKPGNPTGIEGLADLATAGVVSLCVDTAPCGKFADQALGTAGVSIPDSSVTRGQDVKATLAAVTEGDAVAGIVYVTDAEAAGDAVESVDIAEADNVIADYPIAVVEATTNGDAAAAFVEYVLGPDGQAVLTDAGFLAP